MIKTCGRLLDIKNGSHLRESTLDQNFTDVLSENPTVILINIILQKKKFIIKKENLTGFSNNALRIRMLL